MNKIIYVSVFVLFFMSCKKQKIGFVNNGTLVNAYAQKIEIDSIFQLKNAAFKIKTDSIGKAFQLVAKKDQADAQKLYKQRKIAKAEALINSLKQKQQKLQQELQIEQQLLTKDFQVQIDTVIVKVKRFVKVYGEAHGFTYILGTTDATSTVMYGEASINITKDVLKALNEAYKTEE